MKLNRNIIFIIGLVVTMLMIMPTCFAYQRFRDLNGNEVYWCDDDIPVTYWIFRGRHISWTDAGLDALRKSFQTWQDVDTSYMAFHEGGLTDYNMIGNDGYNIVGFDFFSFYGFPPSLLGVALVFTDETGRILDCDIVFNLEAPIVIGYSPHYVDFQSLATHEIGHFVGLADLYSEEDVEKVMYGVLNPGEIKRKLTESDKKGISKIYPDFESSSGCFIATEAFDVNAVEVITLRRFKDSYLKTINIGRIFTGIYYRISPEISAKVKVSNLIRFVMRLHLSPVVKLATWMLN